jgi:predicted transcriptional regulator
MLVLLSIKPVYAEKILAGEKVFEFRRRIFARREIKTALIYCTKPVGCFVGEFEIEDILHDKPNRLWKRTRGGSGISKKYFDSYFAGREEAFALQIGKVRAFAEMIVPSAIIENFTPPQSFMYVPNMPFVPRPRRMDP